MAEQKKKKKTKVRYEKNIDNIFLFFFLNRIVSGQSPLSLQERQREGRSHFDRNTTRVWFCFA